jgi:protein TonB
VTDRQLLLSLMASLALHLALVPVASRFFTNNQIIVLPLPIQLIEVPQTKLEEAEPTEREPVPKPKPAKITAPRLLSKPKVFESRTPPREDKLKEETNERKNLEPHGELRPAELPETRPEGGWNIIGSNPGEAGVLADGIVIPGGENATSGLDHGPRSVERVGSTGSGKVPSADARPLERYQIKPRYPDSAKRARAQGTTFLKFRVLATGKVGEVFIEKSAGRRDLDEAAADAVKKWLFEPARLGTEPVAVWVTLPVEFKLN